jgi:uncharacterized protein YodC (DUF2158 family)
MIFDMSQITFNIGDLVQLRSGGPVMTVAGTPKSEQDADNLGITSVGTVHNYRCHWFGGKKLEEGFFRIEELKPAEDGEK